MATAPRPGASRRDDADKAFITVKVDGVAYTLRPNDLSAKDSSAVRKQTGLSLRGVMVAAEEDPDLDVLATIVWLARCQSGDFCTFDDVAAGIGYDADIEFDDEPPEDDEDDEDDSPEV